MIVKYILILGIGHLLGDFYFQNEKIAKKKDEKMTGVLVHSGIGIYNELLELQIGSFENSEQYMEGEEV